MIEQGQTTAFKEGLYQFFLTDTIMMALYTANADINQLTTVYTTTGEVTGTGYTAGGVQMLNPTVASSDGTVYVSFDNPYWSNASFTARCALIYNTSNSDQAIAVIDFGSDKTVSNQTFTVTFPANTATAALIRSSN